MDCCNQYQAVRCPHGYLQVYSPASSTNGYTSLAHSLSRIALPQSALALRLLMREVCRLIFTFVRLCSQSRELLYRTSFYDLVQTLLRASCILVCRCSILPSTLFSSAAAAAPEALDITIKHYPIGICSLMHHSHYLRSRDTTRIHVHALSVIGPLLPSHLCFSPAGRS